MGHIPVGMELFSAADDEQWMIIQRQIDEADYYVVIVANKYGSVTSNGISYTEKEYDYATEVGVPALGFVLHKDAPWPTDKAEASIKERKSLDEFKKKIKSRMVDFWSNKDDLHAKVSIALMKTMNTTPREGWVRSSEATSPDVTKELTRLSGENAILRDEIEKFRQKIIEKKDDVRVVFQILYRNEIKVNVRKTSSWDNVDSYECTLLSLFEYVAPNLIDENTSLGIAQNIALALNGTKYYHNWPVGKNRVTDWIADFSALELIEPSKKKHSLKDTESYWSLTKLGKQLLKQVRRIRLEEGIGTELVNSNEEESVEQSEFD